MKLNLKEDIMDILWFFLKEAVTLMLGVATFIGIAVFIRFLVMRRVRQWGAAYTARYKAAGMQVTLSDEVVTKFGNDVLMCVYCGLAIIIGMTGVGAAYLTKLSGMHPNMLAVWLFYGAYSFVFLLYLLPHAQRAYRTWKASTLDIGEAANQLPLKE